MFFERRELPGLSIYSYIVGDRASKRCVLIDPARDAEPYLAIAEREGLKITDILETHVHADYLSGAREIKSLLGKRVTLHCSAMGGERWLPHYADHPVRDGDTVEVGSLTFRACHTPGHTPEHLIWILEGEPPMIFSGDLLFAGSVGRPDLLGEKEERRLSEQLYDSLFTTLAQFPDSSPLFPGHGAGSLCGKEIKAVKSTTLGNERLTNPMMKQVDKKQWIGKLMEGMPPASPYFLRMKQLNVSGPPLIGELLSQLPALDPITMKEAGASGALTLDTRKPALFAEGHIPGAINIANVPLFSSWAGALLPPDQPLCLLSDTPLDDATQLIRIGYDALAGYLEGGMENWRAAGLPIATLENITPDELERRLKGENAPLVIDVRSDSEWEKSHITGATHIPLEQIATASIPDGRPLALICRSGTRATIAASLLKRRGYTDLCNIAGGMDGVTAAAMQLLR